MNVLVYEIVLRWSQKVTGARWKRLWSKQHVTASLVRSNWFGMQFHDHSKYRVIRCEPIGFDFLQTSLKREKTRTDKGIERNKQFKWMWMLEVLGREYILWACTTVWRLVVSSDEQELYQWMNSRCSRALF